MIVGQQKLVKKFWLKKIVGPEILWLKNCWSKKVFGRNFFWKNKFCHKNFWLKKNFAKKKFGQKKFVGPKNSLVLNIFSTKKYLTSKGDVDRFNP